MIGDRIPWNSTKCRHQAECDGEIEMRAFLRQIRRREINGNLFRRHGEAGRVECGLHPLAAFCNRLIRQANDMHAHLARADHDLYVDGNTFYALECNGTDA
ncbi:hypothetical protein D3C80_1369070 [compost metagenome]